MQAYGSDVTTWSATTILQAGSIVGGLTSSEIGTLDLSSNDVMDSIGAHDVYDSAQVRRVLFVIKPQSSKTQCMLVLQEVVDYYVSHGSTCYVTLLDAS